MKLSFVVAALLISVLSTDAQNNIPDLPPPPPPPPPGYPGSQSYIVPTNYNPQVSDPKPQSFPGSAQVSYSSPPGNPGYSNNAYVGNPSPQYPPPLPPPWFPRDFDQRYRYEFEKLFASFIEQPLEMFERMMEMWKNKAGRRKHRVSFMGKNQRHQWQPHYYPVPPQGDAGPRQSYAGQPQANFGFPQGYPDPPQGYPGSPQGYPGPPQGYPGPPQGYSAQQTSPFPAQPSESAVPPASGTQQSNYGSPPNPVYSYHGSVPQQQQQQQPGQSLPAPNVQNVPVPSALPSSQYSAGPAPFVPPQSTPAASVSSGDVKLPGDSTRPASGSST